MKGKRKTITPIDDQTKRKHKCRLIIAERSSYEKYLGGQWFNFCIERVMEESGKIIVTEELARSRCSKVDLCC
jgi:hypothetical protein